MDNVHVIHPAEKRNPRACCTPFDKFDHLTLFEVSECQRLADEIVGRLGGKHPQRAWFAALLKRRHRPIYRSIPDGAA